MENSDGILVMIGAIILLAILGAGFAVFFKKGISKLKEKLDKAEAKLVLEAKTKDLPSYEARRVKTQLKEASAPEIEKKFKKALDEVRKDMDAGVDEEEPVQNEIEKILEADVDEDDLLKNRPHNAHVSVNEEEETDEDEVFETVEEVEFDEAGDVQLDESDVIDSSLMTAWCR